MKDSLQLVKEIRELIKSNGEFLSSQPDIINYIEEQLIKAAKDDADKWLSENDSSYDPEQYQDDVGEYQTPSEDEQDQTDGEGSDLFDQPKDEQDQQDEDAQYADETPKTYQDINAEEEQPQQPAQDVAPAKEAEQVPTAPAKRGGSSLNDADPEHLSNIKAAAADYLKNKARVDMNDAEAGKNPVKFANAKTLAAHENATGDFQQEYNKFLASPQLKNMSMRERHNAINKWKQDFHTKNPEAKNKMLQSASSSAAHDVAAKERQGTLQGELEDLVTAHQSGGPSSTMGQYSQEAAQGEGPDSEITGANAGQHLGGAKTEEGYQANYGKSPQAYFAEQNPEFIKQKKDELIQMLQSKLKPEQVERLKSVDAAAKAQGVDRKHKFTADDFKDLKLKTKDMNASPEAAKHSKTQNDFITEHKHIIDAKHRYWKDKLPQGIDPDNIHEIGMNALFEAAHKYDPKMGNKFETFANNLMDNRIKEHVKNNIGVSGYHQDKAREMKQAAPKPEVKIIKPEGGKND